MGLLGKGFTSKFKSITTLAVSRIVILNNQHKARASYARSDVANLLKFGYHDRALLRVDQWIIELNMLEVFSMIESYCNFLRERAEVLEKNKECPDELKEGTSSLIFASSRCGEFPELHKIREILTSKFGKEFADHAVELHINNRVNSKMIQKLSPRRPTMEIKIKALKQIASEIGVTLRLEQDPILINEDKLNVARRQDEPETIKKNSIDDPNHKGNMQNIPAKIIQDEHLSDRNGERKRYTNTAAAAEKAIKKNSVDDPNHKGNIQNNPAKIIQDEHLSDRNEERKRYTNTAAAAAAEKALKSESSGIEACTHSNQRVAHGKMHVHSSSSKQEDEVISKSKHTVEIKALERREIEKQFAWEESHLSQNPRDNMTSTSRNAELISKEHVEEANGEENMVGELGSAKSFPRGNNDHNSKPGAATETEVSEERVHPYSHALRWNPQGSQSDTTVNPMVRRHVMETRGPTHISKKIHTHHEHVDRKLMSVRTR